MSYTEIYKLAKRGSKFIGETKNSFRGGMYVWNHIAQKYFGMTSFPYFDEQKQKQVWNAWQDPKMPYNEKIVLLSTMDNIIISSKNTDKVVKAFEEFAKEHPNSSFGEQAQIIKDTKFNKTDFIAFNQTSVNQFWGIVDFDEKREKDVWIKLTDEYIEKNEIFNYIMVNDDGDL